MTIPVSPEFFKLPAEDGRVVYHHGVLGPLPKDQDPKQPYIQGPYSDGPISVPAHWWNARVTDRAECPVKIVRSPAQIVALNRMFPYGDTGAKVVAQSARKPYDYMGSSNITIYMPTTGERSDIGLITDNSAYFMLGKDPAPMIDWALSAESCPMHFRDAATGRPIDLLKYPRTNAYSLPGYQGSPWLAQGKQALNGYCEYGGGWQPQQAHYTEMSYMAHVSTLDMGFLEDLQYSSNFTVFCDAAKSTATQAIVSGEYRGIAWAFRNLFMAHVATKDAEASGTLPASCHPSSYWKTLLDNQLAYYSKFMADPANQVFRLVSGPGTFGPWQVDYMLTVLAFGVLTGHSDWAPLYLWALKNAVDRTSGKSGYPPGYGGAYYLENKATWWDAIKDGHAPDQKPLTSEQIAILTADPLNGGKAMYGNEYLFTTRAVIVQAQYLHKIGLVDVKAVYPDLDLCFDNVDRMVRNYGSINPRQSVVLDASQAPSTIPPLPPITPPPTENPPVSNPGTDPLAALKTATDLVSALVPKVQSAVDTLEAQIATLKAIPAGTSVDATALAALVTKLEAARSGLAAAVEDAATPG